MHSYHICVTLTKETYLFIKEGNSTEFMYLFYISSKCLGTLNIVIEYTYPRKGLNAFVSVDYI